MHSMLSRIPELSRSETLFSPYSDCGIFGFTFHGNEKTIELMHNASTLVPAVLSKDLEDYEIERAKSQLYAEVLGIQGCSDTIMQYGPQLIYLNRRVPRQEIATRVASITKSHLQGLIKRYLVDARPSFTNWGSQAMLEKVGVAEHFKTKVLHPIDLKLNVPGTRLLDQHRKLK